MSRADCCSRPRPRAWAGSLGALPEVALVALRIACLPSKVAGSSRSAVQGLFFDYNVGLAILLAWVGVAPQRSAKSTLGRCWTEALVMRQLAQQLSPLPDVTEEVREFYDRYPYPPPVDNLEKYQRHWQDRQRRHADYHLFWPARPFREGQSILIAGCGTSQAAKHWRSPDQN